MTQTVEIAILKEAIRRIDRLQLRDTWPDDAHYISGVCKAGCITTINEMIAEMQGEHVVGKDAYKRHE